MITAPVRRNLDSRLNTLPLQKLSRPHRGWIKAIREALGMTTLQMSKRLGVSQPSVVLMEKSEELGRIQLDTLQRAAEALNCKLVYALVPNEPLETMVRKRALRAAAANLSAVEQTMLLENQSVNDASARQRQLEEIADALPIRRLWDEP